MSQDDNVIIIGAGSSGIAMACQLQRELGFTNFEIYEKGTGVGGTWYVNTYPGCGCDIPSHLYSFSFEKNPEWSKVFSPQPEIQQYMVNVFNKYNLPAHTKFQTECLGADWNKETERWNVHFKDLKTQEKYSKTCKFLVVATGPLSVPNPCPVPGIENFKGQAWHSAEWNHNCDIKDKDVIVIGNGCSAAQIVPTILPQVKSLTQFIRSQHWIAPRPQWDYSKAFKWVMRNVPGAITFHRFLWAALLDGLFLSFRTETGRWLRNLRAKGYRKYMMKRAPEKYHDLLIPKFEPGAKRNVLDTGYLDFLHDPKIYLTDDPLVKIKERSVLTKSGKEYHADAIVYANGFQIHEFLTPLVIKGKSGEDIRSRWRRQGGSRAYMGVMVSDFPNLFTIVGPNTGSGHFSIIFIAECSVNFIIKLMKPLLGKGIQGSIEVTEEAEKRDVEWVQENLKKCVWGNTGEGGWYIDKKTGHNGTTYPHFQTHYWFKTIKPKWADFELSGTKKPSSFGIEIVFILIAIFGLLAAWLLNFTK